MQAVVINDGTSESFGLGVMFQSVLWQLEAWDYEGARVPCTIFCSSGHNLCIDDSVGSNVWDYWFQQPFSVRDDAELLPATYGRRLVVSGHHRWPEAERARMREVAKRWIQVKPDVLADVDRVCETFDPAETLAIHLRGTDKQTEAFRYGEAKRVPDTMVRDTVARVQAESGCWKLYGLTDDLRYADLLRTMGAVVRDIPRGDPSGANLMVQRPGIQTGRNSLIDVLVAARCKAFARTPSNLGTIALALGDCREFMIYPWVPAVP